MDIELKQAIDALGVEHKNAVTDLAAKYAALEKRHNDVQTQLDAVDQKSQQRLVGGGETKSLAEEIFSNAEFKHMGEMGGRGRIAIKIEDFQKKTLTNTAVGAATSGVLQIEREPGIVSIQYRALRLRDLLRSKPTTASVVDYVKVSSFTNNASMQVEASDKAQSDFALLSVAAIVQTIAHWVPVSKQCFDDVEGLNETVNSHSSALGKNDPFLLG